MTGERRAASSRGRIQVQGVSSEKVRFRSFLQAPTGVTGGFGRGSRPTAQGDVPIQPGKDSVRPWFRGRTDSACRSGIDAIQKKGDLERYAGDGAFSDMNRLGLTRGALLARLRVPHASRAGGLALADGMCGRRVGGAAIG